VRGLAALVTDALLYPFQPEQNKQASKMAREVVRIDVDSSGCEDAKSGIKTKGGKNEQAQVRIGFRIGCGVTIGICLAWPCGGKIRVEMGDL
jgi:hypothetical protein